MSATTRNLQLRASEIMTRKVVTVLEEEKVIDAVKTMVEENVECLVIIDDYTNVKGIMTVQDLLKKVLYREIQPSALKVADIMSSPVTTCSESTTLLEIVKMMKAKRIRRVPVVDSESKLVGIITTFDLAVMGWDVSV